MGKPHGRSGGGRGAPLRALVGALALVAAIWVLPAGAQVAPAPGSLDTGFDGDGTAVTQIGAGPEEGRAVAIQPDGRIVVAGFSESGIGRRFALVRYNPDGSLDTSFDGDGRVTTAIGTGNRDEAFAVAIQPDGKIVAAGDSYTGPDSHFALVRYNADGSLDTGFDGDGKVTTVVGTRDFVRAIAVQGDGRILVAGASAPFAGSAGFVALARYNADGSLDTGFEDDDRVPTPKGVVVTDVGSLSTAHGVAIQGDGRIVVAGSMRGGATTDVVVLRYSGSGGLDPSFGPVGTTRAGIVITEVGTATDVATALDLLADGRIVVTGFAQIGSSFQTAVLRYRGGGSLDPTFDGDGIVTTAIGPLSQGFGVAVDGEGRTIVAGDGSNGANDDLALVRYLPDGSLDPAFGTAGIVTTPVGTASDQARGMALQADGRILVAGFSDNGLDQDDVVVARYHGDPPPTHVLTATAQGTGSGTVTSDPAGIDCGSDCAEVYPAGTGVELTATAAPGSMFSGWSGDCSGTGPCQVTVDADRTVTATFDLVPPPGVVATDPADGAAEVPRDAVLSATFDRALESFSLVVVTAKGKAVDGTVVCDATCTTVTFTPSRNLPSRSTLTATVTGAAASGSTRHRWTFATAKRGGKPG